MPFSKVRIIVFVLAFVLSCIASYLAIDLGDKIPQLTDLLATIISILIGVSLAISALLSPSRKDANPHSVSGRVATVAAADDANIYDGQIFMFYIYYASLILAVAIKFISLFDPLFYTHLYGDILVVLFVFISTFSLLWSATLPQLLRAIAASR